MLINLSINIQFVKFPSIIKATALLINIKQRFYHADFLNGG